MFDQSMSRGGTYSPTTTNNVNITINTNSRNAQAGVTQLQTALQNLGNQSSNVSQNMFSGNTKVAQSFQGVVAGARGANMALGGMLQSTLGLVGAWRLVRFTENQFKGVVEAAGDFQKLAYSLNLYSKTAEEANKAEKWLEDLGVQSYGIKTITKAYVDLIAVGLKPTRAEMEGLVGYFIASGQGLERFKEGIETMSTLYQAGTIGFEDSSKDFTKYFKNAISALREYFKMSEYEMSQASRKKALSMGDLIKATLAFDAKNYRSAFTGSGDQWQMITQRTENRGELFQKLVGDGEWFPQLRQWLKDINSEIDVLRSNGTLAAWANEVGNSFGNLIKVFTGGKTDLQAFKNLALDIISAVTKMAEAIKGLIGLLKDLRAGLKVFEPLTDMLGPNGSLVAVAGVGVVTAFLFGPSPLSVLAIATSLLILLGRIQSMKAPDFGSTGNEFYDYKPGGEDPTFDLLGKIMEGTSTGLASAFATIKERLASKAQAQATRTAAETTGLLQGEAQGNAYPNNLPAIKENYWNADQKKAMVKYGYDPVKLAEQREATKLAQKTGQVRGINAGGTDDFGSVPFGQQWGDAESKFKTKRDLIQYAEEVSGKVRLDRYKADMDMKRDDANAQLAGMWQLADARLVQKNQLGTDGWADMKPFYDQLKKQKDLVEDAYRGAIAGETKKYNELNEQAMSEIEQAQTRYNDQLENGIVRGSSILDAMQVQIYGSQGLNTRSELLQVDRQTEKYIQDLVKQGQSLDNAMAEVVQKGNKFEYNTGDKTAFDGILEQLQAGKAKWDAFVPIAIEQIRADAVTLKKDINTLASNDFWGGAGIGIRNEGNAMPTMAQRGVEAAGTLRGAFNDLGATIATFTTTGQADFASFARNVCQQLVTIAIQALITDRIFKAISTFLNPVQSLTGPLSSGYSPTPRASGGPVSAGGWYLVGENGPELLRAGGSGSVVPNGGKVSGGNGSKIETAINITVQNSGGASNPGAAKGMADQVGAAVKAKFNECLMEHMRPGGLLNRR